MVDLTKKHVSFLSAELSMGLCEGVLLANFHTMGEEMAKFADKELTTEEAIAAMFADVVEAELTMCRIDSAECTEQAVAAFVAGYRAAVAEVGHDT